MNKVRMTMLMLLALVSFGEDIPESVRKGEWAYKPDGQILRYHVKAGSESQYFPDSVWAEASRRLVTVRIEKSEVDRMVEEKTWHAFVRSKAESVDDIGMYMYGDNLGERWYCELAPTPTPEQAAWARTLPDTWLAPVSEGYVSILRNGTGYINAWNKWAWNNTSRIQVERSCVPKKSLGVTGGPSDHVFWYDRSMSDDDMLIEVASHQPDLKIIKLRGQYIAEHRKIGTEGGWKEVSWPSGQFMIRVEIPDRLYPDHVKSYLDKYPSRWRDRIEYDPKALILQVVDRELAALNANIDGPLEWIRYSFRTYPFDDALRRIMWIMPRSGSVAPSIFAPNGRTWHQYHNDSIEAIHAAWVKASASDLKLADYREAMVAYRRDLIKKISAVRAIIARDGVGFE